MAKSGFSNGCFNGRSRETSSSNLPRNDNNNAPDFLAGVALPLLHSLAELNYDLLKAASMVT
jgi:hypothetical protein